ncbi:hypothetical protein [Streptomyces sp. NBC_00019]|uniref:hypothetical protein n=1 Tax=Streptomyces sp. NBC_00019 TaxID=2975623 RepID=UPI003243D193
MLHGTGRQASNEWCSVRQRDYSAGCVLCEVRSGFPQHGDHVRFGEGLELKHVEPGEPADLDAGDASRCHDEPPAVQGLAQLLDSGGRPLRIEHLVEAVEQQHRRLQLSGDLIQRGGALPERASPDARIVRSPSKSFVPCVILLKIPVERSSTSILMCLRWTKKTARPCRCTSASSC